MKLIGGMENYVLAGQISDAIITWSKLNPWHMISVATNAGWRICTAVLPFRGRQFDPTGEIPPLDTPRSHWLSGCIINYKQIGLSWIVSISIRGYWEPANYQQVTSLAADTFLVPIINTSWI